MRKPRSAAELVRELDELVGLSDEPNPDERAGKWLCSRLTDILAHLRRVEELERQNHELRVQHFDNGPAKDEQIEHLKMQLEKMQEHVRLCAEMKERLAQDANETGFGPNVVVRLRDEIKDLQAQLAERERIGRLEALKWMRDYGRCTDHGCMFGHPGGMGTNGGCSIQKFTTPELRRWIKEFAECILAKIAELEKPTREHEQQPCPHCKHVACTPEQCDCWCGQ